MPINILLRLQARSLQMTVETRPRRSRLHVQKIPRRGVCVCGEPKLQRDHELVTVSMLLILLCRGPEGSSYSSGQRRSV